MTAEEKLHLHREMRRIRSFEQACHWAYTRREHMGGWLVLTIGQEGLPVVLRSLMGPDDHSVTGPRGLAAAVAAGIPMATIFAELFGFEEGCCHGRGGMFSLFAPHLNHWGCYPIAATQTPLALGAAFAAKYRDQKAVSFCVLGDGAVNQGVFHESLNLAGLFELPVVYLIENNQFAMGTSVPRSSAYRDSLAQRAEGYDIEWDTADGWRLDDLHHKLTQARERALTESRPTVLEISTYRFYGFSIADAQNKIYRSDEDLTWHKTHRDPLTTWENQLLAEGLLSEEQLPEIKAEVKAEVEQAKKEAMTGSPPKAKDLTRHVYWECDHGTKAGQSGRHFF